MVYLYNGGCYENMIAPHWFVPSHYTVCLYTVTGLLQAYTCCKVCLFVD